MTAVGATSGTQPEAAVFADIDGDVYTSGGGFSEYFSRPWYQEHAVSRWLERNGGKGAQYFNAGGRGVPDVSAQGGLNIPYASNGFVNKDGGGTRYVSWT